MARKVGSTPQIVITTCRTAAYGDSDGDTLIDMAVPADGAVLIDVAFGSSVVGATTGTFTATLEEGVGGAGVALAAAATIDVDATVGTVVTALGLGTKVTKPAGTPLQIATVKTGTVSTGITHCVTCRWWV